MKTDKLVLKIHVEENVSSKFIDEVKQTMLRSLTSLIGNLPTAIDQQIEGLPIDETNQLGVASFFNIPLLSAMISSA